MTGLKTVITLGTIIAYSFLPITSATAGKKPHWSTTGKTVNSVVLNSKLYHSLEMILGAKYISNNIKIIGELVARHDSFTKDFDQFDYRKRPYVEANDFYVEWRSGKFIYGLGIKKWKDFKGVIDVLLNPAYTGLLDLNWQDPKSMPDPPGAWAKIPLGAKNSLELKVTAPESHRIATEADWIAKRRKVEYENEKALSPMSNKIPTFTAEFKHESNGDFLRIGGLYGTSHQPIDADETTKEFELGSYDTVWGWASGGIKSGHFLYSLELVYKHPFGVLQNKRFQGKVSVEYVREFQDYIVKLLAGYSEAYSIEEGISTYKRVNDVLGRLGGSIIGKAELTIKKFYVMKYPRTQIDVVLGLEAIDNWDEDHGFEVELSGGIKIPTSKADAIYTGIAAKWKRVKYHKKHARKKHNWMLYYKVTIPLF